MFEEFFVKICYWGISGFKMEGIFKMPSIF